MATTELVFSIQEFFKLVPGLVIFPFSFYIAAKKIGTSISYTYTWNMDHLGGRFSAITLVNHKDKPVVIKGIKVVYEGVGILLDSFETPIILKAYEATVINPPAYSFLKLHGKEWDIPFSVTAKIDMLVVVPGGVHKCKPIFSKWYIFKKFYRRKKNGLDAKKIVVKYNGKVYNPKNTSYILVYAHDGDILTTFVEKLGAIVDSTGLGCNFLTEHQLWSAESVRAALKEVTPGLEVIVTLPA
jgi:hypothetical protein